ncbi:MAG: lytic transglycosylase domain-containing protein [Prevotellaceae bacterium]|nr:lytic transglycosylase domain-containing protein [Prevotellaceae bacterium]
MKKLIIVLICLAFTLIMLTVYININTNRQIASMLETATDSNYRYKTNYVNNNSQVIKVIHAPETVSFAGEELPLSHFDVRESFERELNQIIYSHNLTLLTMRLSGRYFNIIDSILKTYGVPEDFKYLCVAESNLQNAISPAKAVGFWQFLSETGKQYHLEINDEVDERYHFEKSTVAACKYLKESYQKYHNWTLAAASYNMGNKNLNKAIENQQTNNYYDLMLNSETIRYLYRIAAYKTIFANPELYGFYISENDKFKPFKYYEITVNYSIKDIADFAKKHNTNYKMIKILNPWLRKNKLTNRAKKAYKIKIPIKNSRNID